MPHRINSASNSPVFWSDTFHWPSSSHLRSILFNTTLAVVHGLAVNAARHRTRYAFRLAMSSRRVCDRCYKIKAQCVYSGSTATCGRCSRLAHKCEVKRPVLQPGRPRGKNQSQHTSPTSSQAADNTSQQVELHYLTRYAVIFSPFPSLKGLTEHEISLLEFTLHPSQLANLVHGQSFVDLARVSLASRLFFATEKVKDGFLALAMALSSQRNIRFGETESVALAHVHRGSRALQVLGSLQESSIEDARTALVLALILITYNDLVVGSPTLPISRSAMLLAAPWMNQLIRRTVEDTDPNIICVMFSEMFECLVFGRTPVAYFEPPAGNTIVDRYYGICHELLPFLYGVCHLYNCARTGIVSSSEIAFKSSTLAADLERWTPEAAMMTRKGLVPDVKEERHFLLQARSFKLAIQLLLLQIQRSQLNDMLARLKAVELEAEIIRTRQIGTGKPKYLLFPYFVMCIQLYKTNQELPVTVLETMHDISNGMAPKSCQSMFACLNDVHQNQRRCPDLTWFQCVDTTLPRAMGP